MKSMLLVCLLTSTLVATTSAQVPALQVGVSVQEAKTTHATAMPDADQNDAWVIAITANSQLYFGADELTENSLWEKMKTTPHHRHAKFYIKADARAPFEKVEKVLELARSGSFQSAVLLTSQPQRLPAGSIAPPMGLEVQLAPQPTAAARVYVHSAENGSTVKVDGQSVRWPELQNVLATKSAKTAVIKADGHALFGDIAGAVDACVAAQVKAELDGLDL